MASLKRIWTMPLACGALLLCAQAQAQVAPNAAGSGGTAVVANSVDRYDSDNERRMVYHGDVEVVQPNGARLNCDTLTVYFYGPGEGPNAAGQQPKPQTAPDSVDAGSIKQMVAEGHVFYVTPNETVRGDHGVYDAEPDTITMTGNVIAVQGKNVARGDKMIMERKTGHTTMVSDATGRNNPKRVRAVIYNDNQNSQGQASSGQASSSSGQARPGAAKKP